MRVFVLCLIRSGGPPRLGLNVTTAHRTLQPFLQCCPWLTHAPTSHHKLIGTANKISRVALTWNGGPTQPSSSHCGTVRYLHVCMNESSGTRIHAVASLVAHSALAYTGVGG